MLDEHIFFAFRSSVFRLPFKNFILFLHNSGDILQRDRIKRLHGLKGPGAGFRLREGSARRNTNRMDGPVERITW